MGGKGIGVSGQGGRDFPISACEWGWRRLASMVGKASVGCPG